MTKSKHPLWGRYKQMLQRCFNCNHTAYPRYGGRGITVCAEWRQDFWAFVRDMGPCPIGHSIDRIDVNGNYTAANCRWATALTQSRNRNVVINCTHVYKSGGSYVAVITENKRTRTLGSFATYEEARQAVLQYETGLPITVPGRNRKFPHRKSKQVPHRYVARSLSKYRVQIIINGKSVNVGRYNTVEEAVAARDAACIARGISLESIDEGLTNETN